MKVYKFGGASVKDAQGIRNLRAILNREKEEMVVVVSAMGKTTNALERVVNALWLREHEQVEREWQVIVDYHMSICHTLGLAFNMDMPDVQATWTSYDELYDQVVSWGELFSTRIVSLYLKHCGIANQWLDATQLLITDDTFRHANVDMERSEKRWQQAIANSHTRLSVTQGFIGGTLNGQRTTLGREGSDYSAAILANLLNAQSVTIWKDVAGILTADPKKDKTARLIRHMTYDEATRLAATGAQIIHPKTIEPLEEKHIPLFVKPFLHPDEQGTVVQ